MMDLTAITTPFGLLDDATREALKSHGGPYEAFTEVGWVEEGSPWKDGWSKMVVRRVKPQPPKPRDFWVSVYVGGAMAVHTSKDLAIYTRAHDVLKIIHVREVLD